MSTMSMTLMDGLIAAETAERPSLFSWFASARETQARQRVSAYLAAQSDRRLTEFGFTEDDIRALRAGDFRLPKT